MHMMIMRVSVVDRSAVNMSMPATFFEDDFAVQAFFSAKFEY